MTLHVRGAALTNYAAVATEVGLDPAAMLRRFGIEQRALHEPEMRLPVLRVAALLERSAQESGCVNFALRMAERRQLADLGPISLLIAHQPTVRDVLATLSSHGDFLSTAFVIGMIEAGDTVTVREEVLFRSIGAMRQPHELIVGIVFRLFTGILGPDWRPSSVHFRHAAPADTGLHHRMFGPNCQFESAFNGFVCPREDLAGRNVGGQPMLARFAEEYIQLLPNAQRPSFADEARKAIVLLLLSGDTAIGTVAARLGLTERTLQRRLAVDGVEYSQLLNDIRRDLVVRHLTDTNVALSRVAAMMGYSRQSSFNRWFQREFGMAPTQWRRSGYREETDALTVSDRSA